MDNTTTAPETIPASELFTALTGDPPPPALVAVAVHAAEFASEVLEKRTRNTGRRIWQREIVEGDWRDVRPCPPLADLADSMKWLEVELREGRLKPGNYRPASVQDVVQAVVETVTSVRLT
jgi:hypothetical protein